MAKYDLSKDRLEALKFVQKTNEQGSRDRRLNAIVEHDEKMYQAATANKVESTLFGDKLIAACFTAKAEK